MKKGCVFCDNKNSDRALEMYPLIKEQKGIHTLKGKLFPPEGFAWWPKVLFMLRVKDRDDTYWCCSISLWI